MQQEIRLLNLLDHYKNIPKTNKKMPIPIMLTASTDSPLRFSRT
jgi:hypothetical protein